MENQDVGLRPHAYCSAVLCFRQFPVYFDFIHETYHLKWNRKTNPRPVVCSFSFSFVDWLTRGKFDFRPCSLSCSSRSCYIKTGLFFNGSVALQSELNHQQNSKDLKSLHWFKHRQRTDCQTTWRECTINGSNYGPILVLPVPSNRSLTDSQTNTPEFYCHISKAETAACFYATH